MDNLAVHIDEGEQPVCHRIMTNKNPCRDISVLYQAVYAYMAHDDMLGVC